MKNALAKMAFIIIEGREVSLYIIEEEFGCRKDL